MKNEKLGQESAFPLSTGGYEPEFGISKRFYAACAAMQGMIASPHVLLPGQASGTLHEQYKSFVEIAYEYADELLKQENQ